MAKPEARRPADVDRRLLVAKAAASLLVFVAGACSSDDDSDGRSSSRSTSSVAATGSDERLRDLAGCHDGCEITGRIPMEHPFFGPVEIVTFGAGPGGSQACSDKLLLAVDAEGTVVWDPGSMEEPGCMYAFGPAQASEFAEFPAGAPVDRAGRAFLYWDPGRHNGVSVLAVTEDGFDDFQTLPIPDYTAARFYDAVVTDQDGDGTFEILDGRYPCYEDSCAGGPSWSTRFAWNGSDMAPVPETDPTPCGPVNVYDSQPELQRVAALREVTVTGTTCHEVMGWGERYAPPRQLVETIFRAHASAPTEPRITVEGWRCDLTPVSADSTEFRCTDRGTLTFTSSAAVDESGSP